MKVLIVEDERSMALELEAFLKKAFYLCDLAFTAKAGRKMMDDNKYDFILLDLGLPDRDGLEVLQEAKKSCPDASYIILTARGDLEDRIKGLDLGADDYLAKPFSLLELQSRMQAITRRKFGITQTVIDLDGFLVNITDRTILYHVNPVNTITKKEFDLLAYLLLHKNRTLTRAQLSE